MYLSNFPGPIKLGRPDKRIMCWEHTTGLLGRQRAKRWTVGAGFEGDKGLKNPQPWKFNAEVAAIWADAG